LICPYGHIWSFSTRFIKYNKKPIGSLKTRSAIRKGHNHLMLDSTIAPNGTKSTSFINLSPSEAHIYDRARYFARLGKKAGLPLRPKQIQLFLQPLADCDIVGSFFATVPKLAKGASGPNKRYSDRQTQRALANLRRKRLCSLYDVTARGVRVYLLYARPITEELAFKLEQQWEWRTTGFCASAVLSFAQNVTLGCQDVTHNKDPESFGLGSKTSTYTVTDQAAPLLESAVQGQQTLQGGSLVGVATDLCPWEGATIDPLSAAPKPAPHKDLADTTRYTLSALFLGLHLALPSLIRPGAVRCAASPLWPAT
jgi:hypothetical protein